MAGWTDDRVETLKKLWSDGCSGTLIAVRLGLTRNAVIGKAHRLRLAPRNTTVRTTPRKPIRRKPYNKPRRDGPTARTEAQLALVNARRKVMGAPPFASLHEYHSEQARRHAEFAALESVPEVEVPPAERRGILVRDQNGKLCANDALDASACRWPIGDPQKPDFHFCNGKAVPGLPYCAQHNIRAYVPPQPARRPYTNSSRGHARSSVLHYVADIRTLETADK